jgi:hypothetical protein
LRFLLAFGAGVACSSNSLDTTRTAGSSGGSTAGRAASAGHAGGSASNGDNGANAGRNATGGDGAGNANSGGAQPSGGAPAAGTSSAGSAGFASGGSGGSSAAGSAAAGGTNGTAGNAGAGDSYNAAVLADEPVAFWAVNLMPMKELDLTGNGHDGTYRGQGAPIRSTLPNGDQVAVFDGSQQYLSVPSSAVFSIPTTGLLTWEAWIRPDVLQFPHDDGASGYVDWLGKCETYSPTCEWEARLYDTNTQEKPNRPNRFSAYVFNSSAGLGSGADWQPNPELITAGAWYHVVGQYTTLSQPADCSNTASAPGSIDIWLNGVKWNHGSHGQTGCMSQYNVVPKANSSPVNIATMSKDSFFRGAIGKVAIYAHALSQAQITNHYAIMTGKQPSGSCANTCSF